MDAAPNNTLGRPRTKQTRHISIKHARAVTFVALGNGAPDLSANVAAIQAGEVVLSAGGITGAAMFVQCVVAAEVRVHRISASWRFSTPS